MEGKKFVTVYLVRHYFRTTDRHPDGPNLEAFYYWGKQGQVICCRGSYCENDPWLAPHDPLPYELICYGYKRVGDAKRAARKEAEYYAAHPSDGFTDHQFVVVAEGYWA